MRRLMALTGALVLATAPLLAQTIEDQVTTFQLENGMDVVVIEDHRAPAVVHMVWYRAGSADEQPGVSGVAHFIVARTDRGHLFLRYRTVVQWRCPVGTPLKHG